MNIVFPTVPSDLAESIADALRSVRTRPRILEKENAEGKFFNLGYFHESQLSRIGLALEAYDSYVAAQQQSG
jgi:hypothetical protein